MARKVVGIDMDERSIKVVEVIRKGKTKVVTKLGTTPLPVGALVDGKIQNVGLVTKALEEVLLKQDISAHAAIVGLRSNWVTVKSHRLPTMPKKELDKALEFEIPELISFTIDDLDDVCYDYFVNWESESEKEIVLVACSRKDLEPYIDAVNGSGLGLEVIDLSALGWVDLLGKNSRNAYVEISEEQTTILVVLDGSFKVLRVVPVGAEHFREGIMEAFLCGEEEVNSFCTHRDLDYLLMEGTGNKRILRATVQQLVGSVLQTLDFVRAQGRATKFSNLLDEVILLGELADLQGLTTMLAAEVDLPVRSLKEIEDLGVEFDFIRPEKFSRYGTALSLALRGIQK